MKFSNIIMLKFHKTANYSLHPGFDNPKLTPLSKTLIVRLPVGNYTTIGGKENANPDIS